MDKIKKKRTEISLILLILCLTLTMSGCGAIKQVSEEIIEEKEIDHLFEDLMEKGEELVGKLDQEETDPQDYTLEDLHVLTEGFFYGKLPEEKQRIYKGMLHGLMNHEESFRVTTDLFADADNDEVMNELDNILRFIQRDHPELFWQEGGSKLIFHKKYIEFEPVYLLSVEDTEYYKELVEEELLTALAAINEKVDDPSFATECDIPDYRIARATFEYVIDHVEYDLDSEYNQVIISSMVNGSSVCAGIARMCQYILQNYGIEATMLDGTTFPDEDTHAWLLVNVNGDYYYMDPTFGNVEFKAGALAANSHYSELNYNYGNLLMNDEVLHRDRKEELIGGIELPACTSDELFYFKLTNSYFTEDSEESDWRDHYVSTIGSGWPYWEVQFEDNGDFEDCRDCIGDGSFSDYLFTHADASHLVGCTEQFIQFDEGCQVIVWWAE